LRRRQQEELASRFPWVARVEAASASYAKEELHLIGVSGGVDSRVLLHLLPMIGFRRLVICHLNHNLRGDQSREDSKFVQRLSHRLGLPLHAETLAELISIGSLESSAREARLEFFARAAQKFSTLSVFLAHHADDQVETFLFNLFRGCGSLDNAAIKTESLITVGKIQLQLRHPLLHVWKDEIREFASAFRLKSREDPTNLSREMTRNRIRHQLIPEIERLMQRPVKPALLRTIEIASKEGEFVKSHIPLPQSDPELATRELRNLPVAIQRRMIHGWLRNHGIKDCGFDEIEAVRSLVTRWEIAKINLPGGAFCRRRGGRLFLQFPSE
jgi:tRNA(Ile)-lysidine synthase